MQLRVLHQYRSVHAQGKGMKLHRQMQKRCHCAIRIREQIRIGAERVLSTFWQCCVGVKLRLVRWVVCQRMYPDVGSGMMSSRI